MSIPLAAEVRVRWRKLALGGRARACGQVARAADFGRNDRTLLARTHLGHLLHAGDTALGYDLAAANTADADLEAAMARGLVLPDVVLVRTPCSFLNLSRVWCRYE